jgi:hypothetical protein
MVVPFALCTRCPGSSAGCRRDPRAGPSRGVPNQWAYSIHGLIRRIALAGFSVEDRCRNPRAEALAARAKKGGYRPPIKGASRGRPPLIAARRDTKKVSRGFVRQSARLPEAAKKPAGFHVLSAIGVQIPSRRSRRPMMPRTKRAPRTGEALPGALCCQPWAWAAGPVTPLQERKRPRCTALPQHLRRRPDGMKKRRQREGPTVEMRCSSLFGKEGHIPQRGNRLALHRGLASGWKKQGAYPLPNPARNPPPIQDRIQYQIAAPSLRSQRWMKSAAVGDVLGILDVTHDTRGMHRGEKKEAVFLKCFRALRAQHKKSSALILLTPDSQQVESRSHA